MTCIIPLETPSGWHLIGRSPIPFLERRPHPTALLAAGDKVTFVPVSLREYEALAAKATAGSLNIIPIDESVDAAA
jgi:allophanate hydrolase subunit 1